MIIFNCGFSQNDERISTTGKQREFPELNTFKPRKTTIYSTY